MATDTHTEPDEREKGLAELRELFADAPEVGKKALESVLKELTSQASETPPPPVESAGRVGSRLGKVSELTIIVPLAPGGAERLRAFLRLLGGNLDGADKVGSVHDMRFVFLDNDTQDALRHRLRRRLGRLHRRLRRRRSPTTWTSSTPPGRAGRGSAAPRRRTTSPSTRSRPRAGTSANPT